MWRNLRFVITLALWALPALLRAQTSYPLVGLKQPSGQIRTSVSATASGSDNPGIWVDGIGVLTTAGLTIHEDDPMRYNVTAAGLELELIGGYWDLDTTNILINQSPTAVYRSPAEAAPPTPKAAVTILGASNYKNNGFITLAFIPESILDLCVNSSLATSTSLGGRVVFRFDPEEGMVWSPGFDSYSTYGGNADVSFNVTARDGSIVARDENAAFVTPQVQTISVLEGGIAGKNIGVDEDLHIGAKGYLNGGAVFGAGSQHHGPAGGTWWETVGSGTAPYAGYQETVAYTDQQGWRIRNNFPGVNIGTIGNTFNFDDDILSSGTIETTSAAYIGGRVIANTAAPVTAGAQLQSPSLGVGAGVAANSSYATAGHVYVGTSSGATQNVLDIYTDNSVAYYELANSGSSLGIHRFRGASGKQMEMRLSAFGSNQNSAISIRGTGTGNAQFLLYEPGSSGSTENATNFFNAVRATNQAQFNCRDADADVGVIFYNDNATFTSNYSFEGRVGIGTTTPPTSGASLQTPSISINGGTTLAGYLSNTATLDFASIGAGATAELTITVTGAATGDTAAYGAPSGMEAGLIANARVSASNTVTIRLHNTTGAGIDPASATWRASVFKH